MIVDAIAAFVPLISDFLYLAKWLVTYTILRIVRRLRDRRFNLYDANIYNDPVKQAYIFPELEKQLESLCPESHLEKASDEVFIYGVNSSNECAIIRISRGGNEESEAWLYLKLKDGRTYRLTETLGHEQNIGDGSRIFSCGGLQMHYTEPMRSWRIFFSGLLSETIDGEESLPKTVFVKFALRWKASSDVFDLTSDMNLSAVASGVAKSKWKFPFLPPVAALSNTMDMYCQAGILNGVITAEDRPEYEVYLFGEKVRYRGEISNIIGCKFQQILGNTPGNGLVLHVGEMTAPNMFKKMPFGFVVHPNRKLFALEDAIISSKLYAPHREESNLSVIFSADKHYELTGKIIGDPIKFNSSRGWEGYMELKYVEFTVGNHKGGGVIITGEVLTKPKKAVKKQALKLPKVIPLTVNFSDDISSFSEISGGKGASLGKLTKLSSKDKSFIVPRGITVTTSAYKEFLNSDIITAIKNLEDVAYGRKSGDISEMCENASVSVMASNMPHKICSDIQKQLKSVFSHSIELRKFAVRSSATGEDTEQMSAAGQMDTFLGIQGLDKIFNAVKKCWASQFGYIAVEYKRRNGQVLNSPMAVVIQEMVPCEVAGVLFTCDPVTNNPSQITITGNYGLGETVVSGSEEPDTVILGRDEHDGLSVESVMVGSKNRKIVMQDDGGVKTEDVPEEDRLECCVSNEMAERLGRLAIKIEKYYRSPRDIEWGIHKDTIYILQSRPITSGSSESDFEIKHEFDAPLRCEQEYHSFSNVGEVMPGATSPLGLDLMQKFMGANFRRDAIAKLQQNDFFQSIYYPSGVMSFYNHLTMGVVDLISRLGGHESMAAKATMIGVYGRLLENEEIFALAKERATTGQKLSITAQLMTKMNLFFGTYRLEKEKKRLHKLKLPKGRTSKEMLQILLKHCSEYDEAIAAHMNVSGASMTWNIYLFQVLGKNKENFDTEVYNDFARLLSSSTNVESADVPAAIQNLAYYIVQEIKAEEFQSMAIEDAINWLHTTKTTAGEKFQQFLKRHGHRCLKEFDVYSVPWDMDQKTLVKLLQTVSSSCKKTTEKKDNDYNKIFSELNTNLDFKSKCLLRFLIPNSRRVVGEREQCKSVLIKAMDIWRRGFLKVGDLMFSEGRIPDKELIFFMTINEIIDLLETRSPKIISRAVHRRKLFPEMDKYIFPEMMKGIPKPSNENSENAETYEYIADLTMKGLPVSQGVIKAYARVAMTLEEAAHLKHGEILITNSTDIGWSPYFPILAGVVTELGGLISHGAVISREYGLPCVVGIQGATRQFKTGDYVLLDGNQGILQRLPNPETP